MKILIDELNGVVKQGTSDTNNLGNATEAKKSTTDFFSKIQSDLLTKEI